MPFLIQPITCIEGGPKACHYFGCAHLFTNTEIDLHDGISVKKFV